jgi:hypothetical protein
MLKLTFEAPGDSNPSLMVLRNYILFSVIPEWFYRGYGLKNQIPD